ncbi:MAG: homocysteine S-methyltransferase family protein [Chloroflexota bacterium]|nr:homocysteine S-methyltransferase family protein [Chloroflexota bacterium]
MVQGLRERLAAGEVLIFDGAIGTMLQQAGLGSGDVAELWNIERPETVKEVHRGYKAAGADLFTTNSFQGSPISLAAKGLGDRTFELNFAAARLAREVAGDDVIVAGSMGPTGQFLEPLGTLSYEEVMRAFAQQAEALVEGGVDILLVETMSDLEEAKAAVEGALTTGKPAVSTMAFDLQGRTMMGVSAEQAARELSTTGVVALGANCGDGPEVIRAALEQMHPLLPDSPLIARPNAGLPELVDGVPTWSSGPDDLAAYVPLYLELGARIIGSCCGSTPDHTRAIAAAVLSSVSAS